MLGWLFGRKEPQPKLTYFSRLELEESFKKAYDDILYMKKEKYAYETIGDGLVRRHVVIEDFMVERVGTVE
jgi:hypothetical protein